jgi:uncharacterized protein involved in exopolysaccharide biosynthesis
MCLCQGSALSPQVNDPYVNDGVDALSLLTPLLEKRRQIIVWSVALAVLVGVIALLMPLKYKAELSLTPVVNNKSSTALGGFAALAGATLNNGYQLTPTRMVELLKSRTVLAGVGMSRVTPSKPETVIDRLLGEKYTRNDEEEVEKKLERLLSVGSSKETGTISVSVFHRDSALARVIAERVVDSASQIFVRTSKAQAQQLRIAQEGRVESARSELAQAEERLRQFRFANRATPPFSAAAIDLQRLNRDIQMAEQVYTQAITDQQAAYARELEATPTVVVQDPLPPILPKLRKQIPMKVAITGIVSFVLISIAVLLIDLTKRRLSRTDSESDRFRKAVSTLPRLRKSSP